jgi:sigma-B regulation protein RsbU (phosphoserine phosphatase)
VVVRGGNVSRLPSHNVPIGLLRGVEYGAGRLELAPGDRIVMVTDGVTEAANAEEEFFGEERLEAAVQGESFEALFSALDQFCAGTPFNDDCTVVELTYLGEAQSAVQERSAAAAD